MLPELVLREEQEENTPLLVLLGLTSVIAGFAVSNWLIEGPSSLLVVSFSAVPLIYPLTSFFFDDEKNVAPHIPEIKIYFSLFLGQFLGFFTLSYLRPDSFQMQASTAGLAGNFMDPGLFKSVLAHNVGLFFAILAVSFLIGSAGVFILSWNASVLGVFLASLAQRNPALPVAYVPHASLEMLGFISAGILGTLASATVYREHFDLEHWINLSKLLALGLGMVVLAALLEST